MSINMSAKVDIYLRNPSFFQNDLENQKSIWMDNFVRPVSSHYEAALNEVKKVFEEAKRRQAQHQANLARIDAINGLVLSVLLAGIDIMSASALKNVTLLSRFSSSKGLEHFLTSSPDTATAVRQFLTQSKVFSDGLVANLDDRLKGLAQTSTVTSAAAVVRTISNDINAASPSNPSVAWPGPLQYQNDLVIFYSTTSRLINESFVRLVRDSPFDPRLKRSFIELFVNLPFVRPPTLSMRTFNSFFKRYYEVCYWCDYLSGVPALGLLRDTGVDPGRHVGIMRDGFLADTINERLANLTGLHLTHTGMSSGMPRDIRLVWDGFMTRRTHLPYLSQMRVKAFNENIKPLLTSAGISTTRFS